MTKWRLKSAAIRRDNVTVAVRRLLGLTLALAVVAGCGGEAGGPPAGPVASRLALAEREPPAVRTCRAGSLQALRSPSLAYAAFARRPLRAFRRPGSGPIARFGRLNMNGVSTVFGVLSAVRDRNCRALWYHVQLPRRPNGRTGFVRARDVLLRKVRTRVVVDLSRRTVTLYRRGRPVLTTTAAIGSRATPTPVGSFYVNQRLIPYDTSGPFGPGAIGISAFSDVLTGWAQGGPVAIHGTNQPWSIGRAVSNGCIRVRNPALRRLFTAAAEGTPVLVRR